MKDTKIEWSDHSFSPWLGCTKVSPGCANCYAEHLMDHRMKRVAWGPGNERKRTSAAYWRQPLKWNHYQLQCPSCGHWNHASHTICHADKCLTPADGFVLHSPSVFPSLCDWLDPEAPVEWLADFLALIHATPNLRWLLLTKRPQHFQSRIADAAIYRNMAGEYTAPVDWLNSWGLRNTPPQNVAIGVSAEDQQRWDERVPELLKIPARWRFVSVEPMLGPIDMHLPAFSGLATEARPCGGREVVGNPTVCRYGAMPNQIIFGGESGPGARPCNVDWIRDGVRQCREAGVAAFVKQLGSNSYVPAPFGPLTGKANDPSQWPTDLRVREGMVRHLANKPPWPTSASTMPSPRGSSNAPMPARAAPWPSAPNAWTVPISTARAWTNAPRSPARSGHTDRGSVRTVRP